MGQREAHDKQLVYCDDIRDCNTLVYSIEWTQIYTGSSGQDDITLFCFYMGSIANPMDR